MPITATSRGPAAASSAARSAGRSDSDTAPPPPALQELRALALEHFLLLLGALPGVGEGRTVARGGEVPGEGRDRRRLEDADRGDLHVQSFLELGDELHS